MKVIKFGSVPVKKYWRVKAGKKHSIWMSEDKALATANYLATVKRKDVWFRKRIYPSGKTLCAVGFK